jgi:hypothetical protein
MAGEGSEELLLNNTKEELLVKAEWQLSETLLYSVLQTFTLLHSILI